MVAGGDQAIDPRLGEMLPPLIAPDEIAGTLRPELAAEWGLGDGVIVSAGGGDNMMGAIGTGNVARAWSRSASALPGRFTRAAAAGHRSARRDRGVLRFDRALAAAASAR